MKTRILLAVLAALVTVPAHAGWEDAVAAYNKGDYATALKLQDKLMPLHQHLFVETNPSPAKYALSLLGKISDEVRLPMVPLSDKSKAIVRDAMVHAGLIN